MRAERALLHWIPLNYCLYAFRLEGFVRANNSRLERRLTAKDKFYRELSRLMRNGCPTDVVFVVVDVNAQLGYLPEKYRQRPLRNPMSLMNARSRTAGEIC